MNTQDVQRLSEQLGYPMSARNCDLREQGTKSFSNEFMIEVKGKLVDDKTRCEHYHSPLDIIAIKFRCCGDYYPCYQCHEETTDHQPAVWKKEEWNTTAILCGVCKKELTINDYFNSNNYCPNCKSAFNPGCSKHYHLYFEK